MISIPTLIACGVLPPQARLYAEPLREACARFEITTAARAAAFLGQVRQESGNLRTLIESYNYTTAEQIRKVFSQTVPTMAEAQRLVRKPELLANKVQAGKNGNGGEDTGDGWRFRGRGLIQLTGRSNYAEASQNLGFDYVASPDLVLEPLHACLTAAWFFAEFKKLNPLADEGRIDDITRAVNGRKMMHAEERRQYTQEALTALTL